MKNKHKIIILSVIFFIIVGFFFLYSLLTKSKFWNDSSSANSLQIKVNENSFYIDRSGEAIWTHDGNTISKLWEKSKTDSFFDYIYKTYGTGEKFELSMSDELVAQVLSEGSSQNVATSDISSYFATPTSSPNGSEPTQTSSPSSGGGGYAGDGGIPSWCKHWRLSYCADTPPPQATLTPSTASPSPQGGATPLPPDCTNPGNQRTGKTVIGNELCLPSETP